MWTAWGAAMLDSSAAADQAREDAVTPLLADSERLYTVCALVKPSTGLLAITSERLIFTDVASDEEAKLTSVSLDEVKSMSWQETGGEQGPATQVLLQTSENLYTLTFDAPEGARRAFGLICDSLLDVLKGSSGEQTRLTIFGASRSRK